MPLPVMTNPVPDPSFGGRLGPYFGHPLATVCGTRENPYAAHLYAEDNHESISSVSARTPSQPLSEWLRQVHSLDSHADIAQSDADEWPLAGVIGQAAPSSAKGLPFPLPASTYLIDYQHLASVPGKPPTKAWVNDLRSFFPEGSTLLLGFFGGDRKLTTALWVQSGFWREQFLEQFDAIVGPDFCSYCNTPTAQVFIAERMQQVFLSEGAALGHVVIPMISWVNEASLRRQVDLWASMPQVNTILLNCYASGVNRTAWRQRWLVAMRRHLAAHRHIRWIITGMTPGWAIRELNEIFPDRNYSLLLSGADFIAPQRSATDRELMARRYQRTIRKVEDFRTGRTVAAAIEMPEEILSFSQCLV